MDILNDDLNETVQAAPEHHNIEELLMAQSAVPGMSDTMAALQGLDLGGKTLEEAAAEQLKLQAQISAGSQKLEEEVEQAAEEEKVEENLPISRKDAKLNSLVNFENLNKVKEVEKQVKEPEHKPVYIDPSKTKAAASDFVPKANSGQQQAGQPPQAMITNGEPV